MVNYSCPLPLRGEHTGDTAYLLVPPRSSAEDFALLGCIFRTPPKRPATDLVRSQVAFWSGLYNVAGELQILVMVFFLVW